MTTIDNIMALALNYRLAGSASRDEHEEALRSALTKALEVQPVREPINAGSVVELAKVHGTRYVNRHIPGKATYGFTSEGLIAFAAALAQPVREPLTDEQIEKLRDKTFSINNPFCPVDGKSMRKAVRAVELAHGIGGDK